MRLMDATAHNHTCIRLYYASDHRTPCHQKALIEVILYWPKKSFECAEGRRRAIGFVIGSDQNAVVKGIRHQRVKQD